VWQENMPSNGRVRDRKISTSNKVPSFFINLLSCLIYLVMTQVHNIINCYVFQLMSNSTSTLSSAVFSILQCGPSNSSPAFFYSVLTAPPRRTSSKKCVTINMCVCASPQKCNSITVTGMMANVLYKLSRN